MGDNLEIPIPEPKTVGTVVEAPNEAIQHVVAHEGRITHLEEQQARHAEEVARQINETRTELFSAIENARTEQASMLESKLSRLEELADKLATQVVETPQEIVDVTPQEVIPEVEKVPAKIIPKGLRERRKMRHRG